MDEKLVAISEYISNNTPCEREDLIKRRAYDKDGAFCGTVYNVFFRSVIGAGKVPYQLVIEDEKGNRKLWESDVFDTHYLEA